MAWSTSVGEKSVMTIFSSRPKSYRPIIRGWKGAFSSKLISSNLPEFQSTLWSKLETRDLPTWGRRSWSWWTRGHRPIPARFDTSECATPSSDGRDDRRLTFHPLKVYFSPNRQLRKPLAKNGRFWKLQTKKLSTKNDYRPLSDYKTISTSKIVRKSQK